MPEDRNLKTIFNEDAELYDQARPGYPAELFHGLGELARIGPGARVADGRRRGLFTCIGQLITRKYRGAIVKRYLYELRVATKR